MSRNLPERTGNGHPVAADENSRRARPELYPAEPAGPGETLPINEFLTVLRRHVWLVLTCAVLGLAVAAYQVYTERPRYRAHAVIRLTNEREQLAGGIGTTGMARAATGGADRIASQLQVLRSRGVAAEVVDAAGLRLRSASPRFSAGSLERVAVARDASADTVRLSFSDNGVVARAAGEKARAAYGERFALGGVRFVVPTAPSVEEATLTVASRRGTVGLVRGRLEAQRRGRTNVIDLTYVAYGPERAQEVVNAYAETFQALRARAAQQEARRRAEFIRERLEHRDSLLAAAQRALSDFRRRHELFSSEKRFLAQQTTLAAMKMRREELAADRDMLESLIAQLERADGQQRRAALRTLVASPALSSNPVVSTLYGQLVAYRTALDSLTAGAWGSAPTNPRVEKLEAMIVSTERKLVDAARSQITAHDSRIASVDALLARNAAEIRELPDVQAEEVRLAQRVATIRASAEQLRADLQQARIAQAVEAGPVEIVDHALLPAGPIGGDAKHTLLFGLLVGLFFGGAGAFLLENLDTKVHESKDAERAAGLEVLAAIPLVRMSGNGAERPERPIVVEAANPAGESFRTLRTMLRFARAEMPRVVEVTSALPGEGKSFMSANLAVALAQEQASVLLVDADLRRAPVHHVFHTQGLEPGLSNVLVGECGGEAAIQPSPENHVDVLHSGTLVPNPAELLGSDAFADLMSYARVHYDAVVVDTPPVLLVSDALLLARIVDGVLAVARAEQTDRDALAQAVQQLRHVDAPLLGLVLNGLSGGAGYGGYYYDSEYYGSYLHSENDGRGSDGRLGHGVEKAKRAVNRMRNEVRKRVT